MKYEEYIKKLNSLDDELEEGMLSDLQQKPPLNLHENIMSSIKKERKRTIFLNYKMYMPVVAAVLIFAVVINKPEIIKKFDAVKSQRPAQEQTAIGPQTAELNKNNNDEIKNANQTASGDDNQKNAAGNSATVQTPGSTANNRGSNVTTNKPVTAKETEPKKGSNKIGGTKVAGADKENPNENINTTGENDGYPIDIAGILGFMFLKEPEVNYEIVLTNNETKIIDYIKNDENGKFVQDNIYKFSADKFKPLDEMLAKDQIRRTTVNNPDESSKDVVLKVLFVNYEITIPDMQPDIVQFINDSTKCVVLGNDTYKLSTENFKTLDSMLINGKIEKKVTNSINGEFVIIRVITVNYEISVNNDQTEILNFIKEKCINIQDNVYEITTEDFKTFEGILENTAIERKIVNEPQNSNIVLRILIN